MRMCLSVRRVAVLCQLGLRSLPRPPQEAGRAPETLLLQGRQGPSRHVGRSPGRATASQAASHRPGKTGAWNVVSSVMR